MIQKNTKITSQQMSVQPRSAIGFFRHSSFDSKHPIVSSGGWMSFFCYCYGLLGDVRCCFSKRRQTFVDLRVKFTWKV